MTVKELIRELSIFDRSLEVEVQWGDYELKIKNIESHRKHLTKPGSIIIINANPSWQDE